MPGVHRRFVSGESPGTVLQASSPEGRIDRRAALGRSPVPMRGRSQVASIVVVLAVLAPAAHAGCGQHAESVAAVDAPVAAIADGCDCATATSHAAHVRCARRIVRSRIARGVLRRACAGDAMACATNSSCGRPGMAACMWRYVRPICRIRRSDRRCVPWNDAARNSSYVGRGAVAGPRPPSAGATTSHAPHRP
jgi:hypothetical protein